MQIMKIGISTNIFHNPSNIIDIINYVSNDFKIIEIEFEQKLRKLYDNDIASWNLIKQQIIKKKTDEKICFTVHAPYLGDLADISNLDDNVRKKAVNYLSKFIVESSDIGSKYITIHPGYLFEKSSEKKIEQLIEQLDKSLFSLSNIANEHKVQILLENTGSNRPKYIVLPSNYYKYFYERYNIGVTMDIVHYHTFHHNIKLNEYFDDLNDILPFIKNAHFNDLQDGKHIHLPLGMGNFNYKGFINYMIDNGYSKNFIMEETGMQYQPIDYINAAKKFISNEKI